MTFQDCFHAGETVADILRRRWCPLDIGVDNVPEEQAALPLRAGRTIARLFYSLMFAVGTALVIGRTWMLPPHR